MLPCENSLAGRVPDIHHLLPDSGLFVVGEHFQRVEHCLLAPKGAAVEGLRRIHSHPVALGQIRRLLRELDVQPVVRSGHRGRRPARRRVEQADETRPSRPRWRARSTASTSCARNVEDAAHNTTRFYVMAPRPVTPPPDRPGLMTTFVFRVRNVPAALYKALGGFATNAVNMTKLESYMVGGSFTATQFLCDVDGHPEHAGLRRALEELSFFSTEVRVLGVYQAAAFRSGQRGRAG